ncbi:leucine-rich repeat domain-containing protein [Cytobacillus purgationiresistens]|uniref:LPXTG-motif cell wall-anchored protein n=1 Tax=Cytobacillus purgationiresistens TaxID=863449 RepID=A0ABU0AFJ1_9BACI|nr:leucine-rich repeat domain-containing protein [Cytobacillus purgationiresistens]MDQ0269208.1 LPXTG-motif cell wall-anchored protein [Cytobacillus purgationiresistens]
MKKFFHVLFAVMLVFSFFSSSVYAVTNEATDETGQTTGDAVSTGSEEVTVEELGIEFDIQLLKPEYEEKAITLKWRTVSETELTLPEEGQAFTIKKNEEIIPITIKPLEIEENSEQSKVYTIYEYTDEEVTEGKEYTYSVNQEKLSSNQEMVTAAVETTDENTSTEKPANPEQPANNPAPATDGAQAADQVEGAKQEGSKGVTAEDFRVLAYRVTDTSAQISWSTFDADKFDVYIDGNLKTTLTGFQNSYDATGLEADKTYKIKVDAIKAGNTVATNEIEIKTSPAPKGKPIEFADDYLYQAVQEELGLKREIYASDMEKLKSLATPWVGIESLEGLQHAVNLEHLTVSFNFINDLTPIKGLTKLTSLDISGMTMRDMSALNSITSLQELNVSHSNLLSLDFLKGLPQLKQVYLYGELWISESASAKQSIADLEKQGMKVYVDYDQDMNILTGEGFINESKIQLFWDYWADYNYESYPDQYVVSINGKEEKLSGETLDKTFTNLKADTEYKFQIKGYEKKRLIGKASLTLKTAKAPTGEVVKFKDKNLEKAIKASLGLDREVRLSDMENAKSLDLSFQEIKNLSGIEKAKNLEQLSLYGNPVVDLSPISGLTKLASLDIDETGVKNLSPLKSLKNLVELYASYLQVKDFSPLSELTAIHSITLVGNSMNRLPNLSKLNNLIMLDLTENGLSSLKGIEQAKNLQYLSLDSNPITDFSPLSNLPLLGVSASYTNMDSLKWAGSEALTRLEILIVSGTAVSDLSPLKNMRHLQAIIADETQIEELNVLLDLDYLFLVSILDVPTLDISEGSEAMKVIQALEAKGVFVLYGEQTEEEMDFYVSDWESSYDSVNVTWAYEGEETITGYNVYLDEELVDTVDGSVHTYRFEGLEPGTGYDVEIEAYTDDEEYVGWAHEYVFTLSEDFYFSDIETTTDSIQTTWAYEGDAELLEYDVFLDGEYLESVDPETLGYLYEGLEADELYKVSVFAYSEDEGYVGYTFAKVMTDGSDDGQVPPPPVKKPDDGKKPPSIKDGIKDNFGTKPDKKLQPKDGNKKTTGNKLPNTSTNMYNLLAIGVTILLAGGLLFLISRKNRRVQG